jgi:hypothetical protein
MTSTPNLKKLTGTDARSGFEVDCVLAAGLEGWLGVGRAYQIYERPCRTVRAVNFEPTFLGMVLYRVFGWRVAGAERLQRNIPL